MERLSRCVLAGAVRLRWSVVSSRRLGTLDILHHSRMSDVRQALLQSRCPACVALQTSNLHSTAYLASKKTKRGKRRIIVPVKFSPKGLKHTREAITVSRNMTVREVADALGKKPDDVFEVMLYIDRTDQYDHEDAVIDRISIIKDIVEKSGYRILLGEKKKVVEKVNKDAVKRPLLDSSLLTKRPPVVTVMGHVDHGKTTLLDSLRKTDVVSQEFGGITQHIGAFSVALPSGETITFIDTPGHAAFETMRARGADVTDIVVLVVAADDGVMPQTIESYKHAMNAGVPVIVAINKVDKPDANVEATKKSLLQHGIQLEDRGGDIHAVLVSALKATNLHLLEDAIIALAEVSELKADFDGFVEGVVLESRTDPGRGKISSALIQNGTLKKGAVLVAGKTWAKVRNMMNEHGRTVSQAHPGQPVEIIGWKELPSAGEEILQVEDEMRAKEVVEWRHKQHMDVKMSEDQAVIDKKSAEHRVKYERYREERRGRGLRRGSDYSGTVSSKDTDTQSGPELKIIIKGDVDGSLEAIQDALRTYRSQQCRLHVIYDGVGMVTAHDVEKAAHFGGVLYTFNVHCSESVLKQASESGVVIKQHNVIYKLLDDLKEELTERLPPAQVEEILGEASVRQQFVITEGKKKMPVAGCRCLKGVLNKKKSFKLVRDGETLIDGELASLKHFKNEVEVIKTDVECGLSFCERTIQPQTDDTVICYEIKHVKQELDWKLDF